MPQQKRILLIVRDFGDMLNPNAYRWNALVAYWQAQGWEVDVVQLGSTTAPSGEKRPQKTWLSFAKGLVRQVYWPDGNFLAIPSAKKRALELATKNQYQYMMSVCLPFSAHWVALAVKKRFPDLYWIADIEDPFALPGTQAKNNTKLHGRRNEQAENEVLKAADKVVFTVASCARRYVDFFPDLTADKVAVASPLFNTSSWSAAQKVSTNYRIPDRINVGYFGAFYTEVREPSVLFQAWYELLRQHPDWKDRAVLQVYGPFFAARKSVYDYWLKKLGDHLQVHPLLDRVEALAASRQMDVLINIGNTTDYQLPSKTPDYLATGRPIINLRQHADCAFGAALADYPGLIDWKVGEAWAVQPKGWWEMRYEWEGVVAPLLGPYRIEAVSAVFGV